MADLNPIVNYLDQPLTNGLTLGDLTCTFPCLLCGRPPHFNGVFVAKDQRRMGVPIGKVRLVRYSLCRRCRRKSSTPKRVEERLLGEADARAQVN